MKTEEEVKNWFRRHKCLNLYCKSAFLANVNRTEDRKRFISFHQACLDYKNNMINKSMTWSETAEGHSYWHELHNELVQWWDEGEGEYM